MINNEKNTEEQSEVDEANKFYYLTLSTLLLMQVTKARNFYSQFNN